MSDSYRICACGMAGTKACERCKNNENKSFAIGGWTMSDKTEYINREEAQKKLKNAFAILVQIDEKGSPNPIIVEASDLLKEIPSADVAEQSEIDSIVQTIVALERMGNKRKRGEWKPFDRTWGREIWACSVCEESVANMPTSGDKPLYDFCPNCGADMRGAK